MRNLLKHLLIFLACILCPAMVAHAQSDAPSLPVIQSAIIRNDARITFEWPEPVKFTADAKGKKITITFARKADPDFGALLSGLYPYVTSAQRRSDGKTIVLTLDKPYKIRTFLTDAVGGIDLLNIDPRKRPITAQAEKFSKLKPAAEGKEDAATSPETVENIPLPTDVVKVTLSASDDAATIRLPFSKRMAIAVYVRNSFLWIVLNNPSKLDISDFDSLSKSVIGKAELVPGKNTILRVPITDDTVKPFVAKEENSFEWAIIVSSTPKPLASPLKVNVNTDPPAPPHVFIPSLEMGDPVVFTDPIIGDELVITPLFNPGEAIPFARDFVEFTLLESTQGIVVAKKADAVSVIPLRNGLRISLPQGATLTPGLPEVENNNPQYLQSGATLFPYKDWAIGATPPRYQQINTIFHQIVDAVESKDKQSANEHRLRLAQVYLSEGFAAEAIGILDCINRSDPAYYRSAKLAALHGAANFLMLHYTDAARDFSSSELNHNKEMEYWRHMLADLNGSVAKYDYMGMNEDYISKYPPVFRQRLAIVAADNSVDTKEYNAAIKIFETLRPVKDVNKKESAKDDIIAPITPYVNFLLAKISVETGEVDDGLDTWKTLAEDSSHPYVQAHAEFARIVWQLNHNEIDQLKAIDRLERLRLIWHGDSLELEIITLLGDLYSEQKDYINAMRIWDDSVNSFPESVKTQEISRHMEKTFALLFSEDSIHALSSMEALTLYYQYKNYIPSGDAGRAMIYRLADRLVSVDLLDQAASLLEHQMHSDAEKVKRSQIGAKVATIFLLNHQPQKALSVLQDSVYGVNPAQLQQVRNRLTSQAFFEMGKLDKAWLVLGQDESADANLIRLNIYWQRKEWKQVITLVEGIMKARKDITAPVTIQESEYLLKLGLAYVFENNDAQLEYLHDYFDPLLKDNPNKSIFDFITAKDVAPTPKNFDEIVKNMSETRSFINSYKARIKLSGLSALVPPVTGK